MKTWSSLLLRAGAAIVVALLAAAPAMAASAVKDWKIIRIGIDSFNPPFSFIDPEKGPSGFDVAIAKTLCERIKARCDFVPAARGALLADLLARRSDAVVASLTITEERKKTVEFTDKYHTATARFVVARTSALTDISPEMMRGKSIGAVEGSRFAAYLAEAYGVKGAVIKLYKSEAEAEADLRAGRIAAVLANGIRLYRWLDDGPGGRCCRFVGSDIRGSKTLGDGAGIAVRREDADLRELFNKAIADVVRDGTFEKINAMYFNFLIY